MLLIHENDFAAEPFNEHLSEHENVFAHLRQKHAKRFVDSFVHELGQVRGFY
jgi:hypothetical protein